MTQEERIKQLEDAIEQLISRGAMFERGFMDGWKSFEKPEFSQDDYKDGFALGLRCSPLLQSANKVWFKG